MRQQIHRYRQIRKVFEKRVIIIILIIFLVQFRTECFYCMAKHIKRKKI
jgi:hypothetical protein